MTKPKADEKVCGNCDHFAQSAFDRRNRSRDGACRKSGGKGRWFDAENYICDCSPSGWQPIGGRKRRKA